MRLSFSYGMRSAFLAPASRHTFTLRIVPQDSMRQRILRECHTVEPTVPLAEGVDEFGNRTTEGYVPFEHTEFSICLSGEAETRPYEGSPLAESAAVEWDGAWFRVPSEKTAAGPEIMALADSVEGSGDPLSTAFAAMDELRLSFSYEKGATSPRTTAEQALSGGCGVCQDYAHILLALLRCKGIPCRYVVGMTVGEGESHAWTEVLSDGLWYGLDPTAGNAVDDRYVRISGGRDFLDCQINKGVFFGGPVATQDVRVSVAEVTVIQ